MANTLFDLGRKRYLECVSSVAWPSATIKFYLIDTSAYTPNFSTHEFIDITSSTPPTPPRISGPITLANKTTTGGAADGDDIRFVSVATGVTIEAIIGYADSGSEATSPLILWIDVATGLPITGNSGDIILSWDNGPNRIFKL